MAKLLLDPQSMKQSLWLAVALSAAPGVFGQDSADGKTPYRFGTSVDAVHLTVTITKEDGQLVTNLNHEDFLVREDGIPQELTYFARGTDAPVDVMLLVDASGSMDVISKVANTRTAAIQLVYSLDPQDRVAVYMFDKHLYEALPFTEDKQAAVDKLATIEPFGSTALYDAVALASTEMQHLGFGRRAIVVMTDGVDTSSELSSEEAVQRAKGLDLPVYSVRVLSPLDDPSSDHYVGIHGRDAKRGDALRRFSEETGGQLFEASEIGALRLAALRIREELKTQYRLGYTPTNTTKDGSFRRIDIETRRRGVLVQARRGYYAKKPVSGSEALLDDA
ncbi:MAG: VWA domain-containing protein, partial [Vicinamibacteria bacterium]